MKYAVIGAGGTGGMIGFYMTKAGKDVTLIARGEHLAKMQEKGLTVERMWDGSMAVSYTHLCSAARISSMEGFGITL